MAARRKRHDDHEEHENHERWLITYADMITLLMAFFIMLFAMSQLDLAKFAAFRKGVTEHYGDKAAPALDGGVGVLDTQVAPPTTAPPPSADAAQAALQEKQAHEAAVKAENDSLAAAEQQIQAALASKGLGDAVRFRHEARGLVVTVVTDSVLFDLGSADLRSEGRAVLDGMADALAKLPNPIVIEGHTDNKPVLGGPFASNWELSTARATSVLRYLVDAHQFPTGRLSAAGYADQRPLVPNDTDAHRAQNRRVEVVVLNTVAGG